ncbi:glycoside hydrolase family 16 protein, partial [Corallococcus sp. CA053C]
MTSRRLLFSLALCGLGTLACDPAAGVTDKQDETPKPDTVLPGTGWTLIWQDEFEGAAGTLPAKDKWVAEV